MPERERMVITGDYARVNWYPVRREAKGKRGQRNRETSLVQKKLNQVNRERRLADLLHLNFTEEDYFIRLSYREQPATVEEADENLRKFFRRVRYHRKKAGLGDLKYIYYTERGSQSGKIHHHIFISGGMDRDALEELWGRGYANTRRLQFNERGLAGLSKYSTKAAKQKIRRDKAASDEAGALKKPEGSSGETVFRHRTWNSSKNLRRPKEGREIFKNDYRVKVRDAAYVDAHPDDWRYIEKMYPGYFVVEVEPTPHGFWDEETDTPVPRAHFITLHLCRKDARWKWGGVGEKKRTKKRGGCV